jgi:hypothetical protein
VRAALLAAGLALALGVAAPAPASAHQRRSPLDVAVQLRGDTLAVSVAYVVSGDEARMLGEQFDRDADGTLDDDERTRLRDALLERALPAVAVWVRGDRLELESWWKRPLLGERGSFVASAVILAPVRWRTRETAVAVAVELPDPRAVTFVAVAAGDDAPALPEGFFGGDASRGAPLEFTVTRRKR